MNINLNQICFLNLMNHLTNLLDLSCDPSQGPDCYWEPDSRTVAKTVNSYNSKMLRFILFHQYYQSKNVISIKGNFLLQNAYYSFAEDTCALK